jgi:hypothetical protein
MSKDDNKKIWEYRIQAIVLCLGSVACEVIGYKFIKREEKVYGINKMPRMWQR